MSDRWVSLDPREPAWPDASEWCHTHGQWADSCGPCHGEDPVPLEPCAHTEDYTQCRECAVLAMTDELYRRIA